MFRIVNFGENVMNSSADSFVVFPSFCPLSCSLCLHHLVLLCLGENLMKGSSSSSPFLLPLHHFPLLSNVKWVNVNAGINTTEGCATIVLRMFLCQQEATPRTRPGKNVVARMIAITGTLCSSGRLRIPNGDASASPLPTRENRHAA